MPPAAWNPAAVVVPRSPAAVQFRVERRGDQSPRQAAEVRQMLSNWWVEDAVADPETVTFKRRTDRLFLPPTQFQQPGYR